MCRSTLITTNFLTLNDTLLTLWNFEQNELCLNGSRRFLIVNDHTVIFALIRSFILSFLQQKYGWEFPAQIFVIMIIFTYAVICPVILPFGTMYYMFSLVVYKKQI